MPIPKDLQAKALFEPSKAKGKEHLEWCSDINRIPDEMPDVDKEIKTDSDGFPINETKFKVGDYNYTVYADKDKKEVRIMRVKGGKGGWTSRAEKKQDYSDIFVKLYEKKEFPDGEAKIKELNEAGHMVETNFISYFENNQASTVLMVRGRKAYNPSDTSSSGDKKSEQQSTDANKKETASTGK